MAEKEEMETLTFIAWLVSHTSQAAEKPQSPSKGLMQTECIVTAAQRKPFLWERLQSPSSR